MSEADFRSGHEPSGSREERTSEFVAAYVDRLNAGEEIDADEVRREHPELADAILEQLALFVGAVAPDRGQPLRVLGDYTLRQAIGRGGMGVVYDAWQTSLDRRVALKVLPAGFAADDQSFQRFLREAKAAAKLSHPNIVAVYGTGIESDTPYYAMELIEGETLAQVIAQRRSLEEVTAEKCFELARQFAEVAEGLHHAHARSVVHRDLKPSNLMLERTGRLKILDFGLARLEGQESLTRSGDFIGTLLYMSPEQARRRQVRVDHRTDIYSLGAALYEALTGATPFRGKDEADTLSQIIERDPAPLRQRNTRVPEGLETIVLKCLRKDPGDRYSTAEALAQDLRRLIRGDAIEARPQSPWERAWRRAWRLRRRVAAWGTVALLVAVGAALGTVLWSRGRERTLERYEELVGAGIDGLEVGLLTSPGELGEGETIALGIVYPSDVLSRSSRSQGPVDDAVGQLREAATLVPWRPEARMHLSRALSAAGSRQESDREPLDLALEQDRGFLPALLLKAHRLREGKQAELADALDRVATTAADEPWEATWLEAHRAAGRGEWEAVDRLYTELLHGEARPFAGFEKELRLKRGRVALKRGQHQRALRDFSYARESSRRALGPTLLLSTAYYHADQRAEAAAVLAELLRDHRTAAAAIAVADLHRHFGEVARAREAVETIQDEATREAALVDVLLAEGKAEEAVEAGRRAMGMGLEEAWVYAAYGAALHAAKRLQEARSFLEDSLKRFPGNRAIEGAYQGVLYYLCAYDELIARGMDSAKRGEHSNAVGWAIYRKGELEKASTWFTKCIEQNPRGGGAYLGRSVCHWFLGDFERSVADVVRMAGVDPTRFSGIDLCSNYSEETRRFFEPHWKDLEHICAASVRRGIATPRFLGFLALAKVHGPERDLDRALTLARDAVREAEEKGDLLAEALGYLGEVQAARGELNEAVRSLEHAVDLPGCWLWAAENLRRYREQLFPRFASCCSLESFVKGEWKPAAGPRVSDVSIPGSPELAAYMQARRSEEQGQEGLAAGALEALVRNGPLATDIEAIVRLAGLLSHLGKAHDALELLELKCLRRGEARLSPWIEWIHIASKSAGMGFAEMAERLRAIVPGTPRTGRSSIAADVVWVLESLHQTGCLRINCGGDDYQDAAGQWWGRDRFFMGGEPYALTRPPLKTDRDHELLYPHRKYWERWWAMPGYRIPLPVGRYEVVLRYCETSPYPLAKSYGIEVEGRLVREPFDPIAEHGFAVPFEKRFEVEVADGALELLFTSIRSGVEVNAIEVHWLK